eukprot:3733609-Pyramimonas_sp.AAC.1
MRSRMRVRRRRGRNTVSPTCIREIAIHPPSRPPLHRRLQGSVCTAGRPPLETNRLNVFIRR